jgi:hypothetical protein
MQREIVSERVNIRRITPFNQTHTKYDLGGECHTLYSELKR